MLTEVISDMQTLGLLRMNWDAVYEADPEAQFFLSSDWLFKRLGRINSPWFVLAARPKGDATPYVAFLPLRLKLKMRQDGVFYNEITMAGAPAADYTAFICMPDFQQDAAAAFATHIKTLNWADFSLPNVLVSDERLHSFLKCFPQASFRIGAVSRVNAEGIDNCVCPRVTLPGDWKTYLADALRPNTRQKVRRFLKQVETSPEFRITHPTAKTVKDDIEALICLWETKWGHRKGENLESIRELARSMLLDCFESGSLFLPVLWKDETPIGALASLIDTKNKSFLFYMGGRREGINNPQPGLVLHAYSIRAAIAAGFTSYDFLRGNEAYKYSFGAEERRIRYIVVRTRSGRNLGDRLDDRSLPLLLKQTSELHQARRFAEAERGYRQLLGMQPDQASILYRLGQTLQAQGKLEEAAAAYEAVVKREPAFARAHYNLGVAQLGLGRGRDAVASFRLAHTLQPNDAKARIALANAAASPEAAGIPPG